MRHLLLISALSASVSFAQVWGGYVGSGNPSAQSGVWTGYVNGWVNDPPRATYGLGLGVSTVRPKLTQRQREYLAIQQLAAQQNYVATQNYVAVQQLAAQQAAQLARQEELAAERRRAEEEQALAAEAQLLAQQQQLAVQQQMLAQQQQQAAAEELARVAEREAKVKQLEAELKANADREAERVAQARAAADAKPREKGPDIHRWVDEDGVVHYSTKPRN